MDEVNALADEQILLQMKQEDFETIRVQNPVRYKAILKQYIKIYQPQNLQEIAMCIIKKPSEERNEDEINILQQWTSRFKFFEDLNRKQMNVELRLHHKCCSRIKYEKVSKGTAVFQAGDIPEKFYIVLSGSVNVMLPKSKELLAQEVVNERSRIKNLKTLEIKNSIWYRINQIKDRREQLKMSKNLAYSQSLSPHHNINHFKIPSFQRVDSLTSSRQDTLLENSFPSSPRTNNLRLQNSSRFDPALSNQSDEINITASNFSEHMDQTKLNNSQTEDKSIKNLNFTNKILPKDSRLQERHHHKRGSIFNEFRQYRRESFFSDLNFPIKKDESPADIQASIFKRQNSPIIDFKNLTNESEDNSVIESKDGNGQQEEESQIDLFSTLKLEENNILDENDPAYQQLGNIQLEAIQDLDCFFQQGVLKYKYLLTLNAGSMFGELGLLLKKPRAATILAREDTEFAVLNADDFSNILSVGEMKQINRRLQFFAENFLQGCGKEIVTKYSYNFKCVKYNIGNIIYNQGDSSQFVYIIKKGFVELSQTRVIKKKQDQLDKANSISKMLNTFKKQENLQSIEKLVKEKVCLSQISVGQCFGEIEVIKNMTRISHAICISNKVVLWELPATIFQKLITENKFLYQQFLDQIKLKEEWYQKQEISHGLQKEIKAEISESAKDQQQQQAIQEEIKIRKQKLQKKYSLKCNSFIKGQDEEIEKHIKLELLKEEMEKDMKFLQDLKQMGGYDFLKNQELVKSVEIIGIKKQLNLNQIHKLQRQDEQFDQKVFKVMQKIEYQKKQMKELIRKIMVKNSYKYMPKFKLNEFIGMDIKHALNLQIFSAFQNQTKTEPQKSFETQEEKVDKKLLLDSQQESLNKNLLDKQVDQQDIIAESQENNYDKQFTQPNWIDGYQINNDKNLIVQQEQSQKMEIKKKNQNLKQNFKNKLELAQLDSKKNELFQKFKPQVPLSIKNQSPFSSRDSQSLLFQQQNTSNLFGISGIQKYFQTCKTAREKIMIAQKQQQKTSLIKDQQNNTNCLQIQQIHSNSTRSQQPQINSSQEKSQRFSLNIAELNSNDLEQTRSKQNSQRESVLFYNNYSFIQQNIHNKQMDNHSSIFTVKPFFYTKNQQNLEIQKALPQQDRFREKNMKNMKAHLNKLKTDNQQKLIKHQKSITANINKGEYFFKTNEEIVNVYNVNTSRKDFKRETFQSTQETFRKQYEYEQQKSFQTQNHYVKDISKIQEKENITDKISDDQKQDNYQIINTANEDTFKSFLSINTYSNRQSNIEPNQAVYFHQKNMFVESQHHNLIRSQSNPNITQNCMQFNRKNSNLGINQQPFLSNSQQVKVKASPQIEQPHSTREARFRWPLNSQKHSADCLIAANQINSHKKNQQQNEKYFSQAPISPILLQNDSYQEKNFYMYNLDLGIDIKPKSSLLSKTEQSIENQSLKEQDDKNFNLQSSFCYSIESYNQPLIQKHISLSNSPKKQNFVEMNRKITKPINKQNNYTIKKKTNINPICFQEYNDNEEQDQKYNQEKILKQLIKCRAKQKPKNQSIKETKEDKLIRIKKSLLNYCESSNDLSNSQTLKGKVEVQSQPQKSNNKQLLLKRQNLVKDQNDQMYCQTASSFYPNFDEIQNQLSFNTVNQYANSPSNQERSPPVYNQNSFTSTKHNMFRQKPQKLFLLHNSTNYPLQIYKIESILRTYKNENIK